MSGLLKHLFVSAIADGPDPTQVNPSNWNEAHVFSGGAHGALLMRDTGDPTFGGSWLAGVAAGQVLVSNGVGAPPTWSATVGLGGQLVVTGLTTANGGVNTTVLAVSSTSSFGGLLAATEILVQAPPGTGVRPLQLKAAEGFTSGIVASLYANVSAWPTALHFSDAFTYNVSVGSDPNGTFTVWAGRSPGVAGTSRFSVSQGGQVNMGAYGAGSASFDAAGNLLTSSDERHKDIVGAFTPGLDAVLGMRPIRYRYKPTLPYDAENVYAGFSAQNMIGCVPEAVGESADGWYSLNIIPVVAAAVTAVQELTQEIDGLRARLGLPAVARGQAPVVDDTRIIKRRT